MTARPQTAIRALADWAEPLALFLQREARDEHAFWLDAGPNATSGWSFLGTGVPTDENPGSMRIDRMPQSTPSSEEPPFRGGYVGWLDYESGAVAAGAPADAVEGARWLCVERLLAFDHARRVVWAVAGEDGIDEWVEETAFRLASLAQRTGGGEPAQDAGEAMARCTPTEYASLVEECRELIRRGEAYQLCLTTRFSVEGTVDPVGTYLRLREATPAHHGGFIRIGDRALLSASPELFLHAEGGRAQTRPIKGTRPRGEDAASDAELARELAASEKERAENVMIVDLMRNDLSRVCEPGSIRVDALFAVESYPAVHQLVSTVSGTLRKGTTAGDLWAAAFPAGSMTGAPKLSAMTHLHKLEQGPRGIYSGCFGYIGIDGALDLAMVIRSIVVHPGGAYVGAGGGITWRSEAAAEVAEVATKARAPLAAMGAILPAEWAAMR